ncbi:hypothetical protein [Sulfuricurvum sp.]|uniref:hypothetical protein n=1 Tax=Sulfuricurvum sp. TaxID=2025608 RepID=UPI00262E3B37|nr:hypothetical protein [Sulfuricurvum sp.]MDD4950740.1 hypothetical protein [Sulfuricurvum sp.]
MEQETLQTQQLKKRKLPKWLIILIAIPLVIIAIHFNFYFATQRIVKADESINQEATSYFIHANVISMLWINATHTYLFVDYDSWLMKPLIVLTDYFFEKGEVLIQPHNGEDGVWWYLTYAYIYNLSTSQRIDTSMDIYSLPKNEEMNLRNKLTRYIIKIGNDGVKGVDFGKYESSAMHTMFATHLSNIDVEKHYTGNTKQEKIGTYLHDKNINAYANDSYVAYVRFLKKDQFKSGWELFILNNLNERVRFLIFNDMVNFSSQNICTNKYIPSYLTYIKLINIKSLNRKNQNDDIPNQKVKKMFEDRERDRIVLTQIKNSCPNFGDEINQIEITFQQLKGVNNGR